MTTKPEEAITQKSVNQFFANIPYRFGEVVEADVASKLPEALLAFPINILYTSPFLPTPDIADTRRRRGRPRPGVVRALYTPDFSTFYSDSAVSKMIYRPELESDFFVEVQIDRRTNQICITKYQGRTARVVGAGSNFEKALIQATCTGVLPDEPGVRS